MWSAAATPPTAGAETFRYPVSRDRDFTSSARRATKCPSPNGSSCSPTAAPRPPA